MKYLFILLAMLASNISFAQNSEDTVEYYMDYFWEKCEPQIAHYYRLAYKEGAWWRVKDYYLKEKTIQMDGLFSVYTHDTFNTQQGMFFFYHSNGKVSQKVRFVNGKPEGLIKRYDTAGILIDSGFYKKGIPCKVRYVWENRQIVYKGIYDEEGEGAGEEWCYYENGILSDHWIYASGYLIDSVSEHYYRNGRLSCKDYYDKGRKFKRECYDTSGQYKGVWCEDSEADFIDGKREFRRKVQNIKDRIRYTRDPVIVDLKRKVKGEIVIGICVTENGEIIVSIVKGLHPVLDSFLLNVFKDWPRVKPAMVYNRPEKQCMDYSYLIGK